MSRRLAVSGLAILLAASVHSTPESGFQMRNDVFESQALAPNAFAGETPICPGPESARVMVPRIITTQQPHHRDRYQVSRIYDLLLSQEPTPSWTPSQKRIVDLIWADPEIKNADIARTIESSPQNVNHHLDRIEALLKDGPVPVRRVVPREDRERSTESLTGSPELDSKLTQLNVPTIDDLVRGYSREKLRLLGFVTYEMDLIDERLKELTPPLSLAISEPMRFARNTRSYIRELLGEKTAIPVTLELATGWVNAATGGPASLVKKLTEFVTGEDFLRHLKSQEDLAAKQRTLLERIRKDFGTAA
jgi:hypothetical protein